MHGAFKYRRQDAAQCAETLDVIRVNSLCPVFNSVIRQLSGTVSSEFSTCPMPLEESKLCMNTGHEGQREGTSLVTQAMVVFAEKTDIAAKCNGDIPFAFCHA